MNELHLPQGWSRKKLFEVAEIIMGQSPPSDSYNDMGDGLPFFQGKSEFTDLHPVVKKWCTTPSRIAEENDILLSVRAPVGPTNIADRQCSIGRGLAAIRGINADHKYLYYFLKSIQRKLESQGTGSTFAAISKNEVRDIIVPLPPLPVQRHIVARIEELFSELDAGTQELQTALKRLKTYRQAVLHHYLSNEEWERVKLGAVAHMCLGKMLDNAKNKGVNQPYLRNINVRWGACDLSDLAVMRFEHSEEDRYGLELGDLIVCEGGEPGRAAVWKGQQVGMKIQKALHRIRFNSSVYVDFFYHFLRLSSLNGELANHFTGTTIKHLTAREFAKFEFPYPDFSTQIQIVEEIEAKLSEADAMEAAIRQSLQQAGALRQSILKRAFEGKLITSPLADLTDEVSTESNTAPPRRNVVADQLTLF